jgi:hypothetical protein
LKSRIFPALEIEDGAALVGFEDNLRFALAHGSELVPAEQSRSVAMLTTIRLASRVTSLDAQRLPVGIAEMKHCRSSFGSRSSTDQDGGKRRDGTSGSG